MISRPKVFVGGPIQNAISNSGNFFAPLESVLRTIHTALLNHGYTLLSAHQQEQFGKVDLSGQPIAVCIRDFKWMNACDAFIAVRPPAEHDRNGRFFRTDGTCIELGWASMLRKPTIIVVDDIDKQSHLVSGLRAITTVQAIGYTSAVSNPMLVVESLNSVISREDAEKPAPRERQS